MVISALLCIGTDILAWPSTLMTDLSREVFVYCDSFDNSTVNTKVQLNDIRKSINLSIN